MDFDNRYTLLELFAETTSSEEHGISFEGIHLPQVLLGCVCVRVCFISRVVQVMVLLSLSDGALP